ncbi:MAG: peptide-methionine (S)-S-oxide reductase MsrA [Chitinophagaceae bacterium]|nr:peptide-methionine (S)-S-oxide reductase MsrA [Chitinophagaceae bacterium]
MSTTTGRAIFASGCFWGTEYFFQKEKGVLKTTVGYTGGNKENPTYHDVCTGRTGHAEATEVIFDPTQTSYEQLVKLFFETHDQGQVNRQGPDIGTQYRSAIFYLDEEQRSIAERLINELKSNGYKVATELTMAGTFYKAEDKHQQYYTSGGGSPYCHRYTKKFDSQRSLLT